MHDLLIAKPSRGSIPMLAVSLTLLIACDPRSGAPDMDGGSVVGRDSGSPAPGDDAAVEGEDGGAVEQALGPHVLVFRGEGAMPLDADQYLIDGIDDLVALYAARGARVDVMTEWPGDPSQYHLAFWYQPGAAEAEGFSPAQATLDAIRAWLARGGRLVIAGDVNGEYAGYSLTIANDTIDDILARWGLGIRINEVAESTECTPDASEPLLTGGAQVDWFATNELTVVPPARWLECPSLAVQDVECGEVVVIGDVNPVSDRPAYAEQLLLNFLEVPVNACP